MAAVNGFSHMELGRTERLHPMRRDQALQGASHSQEGSTSRLSTGCVCHVREPCPVPYLSHWSLTSPLHHPITSSTPDMVAPMPSFEGPNTSLPQDLCTCCFLRKRFWSLGRVTSGGMLQRDPASSEKGNGGEGLFPWILTLTWQVGIESPE